MSPSSLEVAVSVLLVARLCLAFFFFPAAVGKLINIHSFRQGIADYRILPKQLMSIIGFFLPWCELLLALALLVGIALPITGVITVMLLICFTAVVVINLRRGRWIACNCYSISGTKTISWAIVVRNTLLLAVALVVIDLGSYISSQVQGFTTWNLDRLTLSHVPSLVLLVLLSLFCTVSIPLVEWAVDISLQISRFRQTLHSLKRGDS